MNKQIWTFLVLVILISAPVLAISKRSSIKIQTRGYVEDEIKVENTPIEMNVIVDIMVRERGKDLKYHPYIFGSNRIRAYGIYEGRHISFELKRIRPDSVTFSEDEFELSGKVDVYIQYFEPIRVIENPAFNVPEDKGREIYYDVPIELEYSKLSEKLSFAIETPFSLGGTIITEFSDIDVGYR